MKILYFTSRYRILLDNTHTSQTFVFNCGISNLITCEYCALQCDSITIWIEKSTHDFIPRLLITGILVIRVPQLLGSTLKAQHWKT